MGVVGVESTYCGQQSHFCLRTCSEEGHLRVTSYDVYQYPRCFDEIGVSRQRDNLFRFRDREKFHLCLFGQRH